MLQGCGEYWMLADYGAGVVVGAVAISVPPDSRSLIQPKERMDDGV